MKLDTVIGTAVLFFWMGLDEVNSFEEWWVTYDVIGSLLGSNVTLECHTRVNKYSNHWEFNRKVENKRQFQYWAFGHRMILPSMNTNKYYYNHTEFQDEPDEYKTTMRLDIKHLEPEDFGTYRCISQPGVQGQTTQMIQLFEIPTPNSITIDSGDIINRAGEMFVWDSFWYARVDPAPKWEVSCHFLPNRDKAYYEMGGLQHRPQASTVAAVSWL